MRIINTLNILKIKIILFFLNLFGINFKRRIIEKSILKNKICRLKYLGKKKLNNELYLIYKLKFPNKTVYDVNIKYNIKPFNYKIAKKLYSLFEDKYCYKCQDYKELSFLTPLFNMINTNNSDKLSNLFIGNRHENTCKYNGQYINNFYVLSKEFGFDFCYTSLIFFYKIYIFNIPIGIYDEYGDYEANLIQKGFLFTKKQREKAIENIKKLPLGWKDIL